MKIDFSLDCEKLWGMKKGVASDYICNNVRHADIALQRICESWGKGEKKLYLAFVIKSLPFEGVIFSENDCTRLSAKGYTKFLSNEYLNFQNFDFLTKNSYILYGLHGTDHQFYSDLSTDEVEAEVDFVRGFVDNNDAYKEIFVYPKNLVEEKSLEVYKKHFSFIRVNSCSWLYKTAKGGPSKLKRILRYLDSFLPIYELFCRKNPEYRIDNAFVGTHFYRANLSAPSLLLHYFRLRVGILIMRILRRDVHIWSHPHNFSDNKLAVELFCRLQYM